jgi:hypothetical protein
MDVMMTCYILLFSQWVIRYDWGIYREYIYICFFLGVPVQHPLVAPQHVAMRHVPNLLLIVHHSGAEASEIARSRDSLPPIILKTPPRNYSRGFIRIGTIYALFSVRGMRLSTKLVPCTS